MWRELRRRLSGLEQTHATPVGEPVGGRRDNDLMSDDGSGLQVRQSPRKRTGAVSVTDISATALAGTLPSKGIDPKRITSPLLVMGAECDGGVSIKEVRATALAYRTEAEVFPDMGHDMMLEPGWRNVALRIDSWLGGHGL